MKGKVLLISNHEEVQEYNDLIEERGYEEAFSLGLVSAPVKPQWTSNEFLFNINDVLLAWRLTGKDGKEVINMKLIDGDTWSLEYNERLWSKLETKFNLL